jgi:hypothetical protein
MKTIDFLYDIDDRVHNHVTFEMETTDAVTLGLDIRAGYRLWVDAESIVIHKSHDGCLQYYGGFEYIEKEYRREVGDYVFYLIEADRVREALDRYYGVERPEEEEEE